MTKALELSMMLPTGSLTAYQQGAHAIPMLTVEEERELAIRFRDEGDRDAAWQLVLSHLRFVLRIARGYNGYGLAQADLVQEGNVGLMKAVKRFDPDVGVRLVSFAVHWVRAEIHEYILRNWRIVKVATTKAQRKLFFNLRSKKKRLGWMSQEEVAGVAEDLGVSPEVVLEMEKRLAANDAAFDGYGDDDSDTLHPSPAGYLEDLRYEPARQVEQADWSAHSTQALGNALDALDARSQDIVRSRWLADEGKATLQNLAEKYGVSAERIRQLEKAALGKLKTALAD